MRDENGLSDGERMVILVSGCWFMVKDHQWLLVNKIILLMVNEMMNVG